MTLLNNMTIGISIVLYNSDYLTFVKCATSILNSYNYVYVTVIDNSPQDNIKNLVEYYGFTYIHLPSNPGYGAAHNIGIKHSIKYGYQYHLVLNADVSFDNDVFDKLVNFMENNVNVGLVMPKVLNLDGSTQRLCKLVPTPFDLLIRRFLPSFICKRMRHKFELFSSGYEKTMFVPYLSGCFMFLRCNALKEVGLFDERFFLYPEDIDLSRRLAIKFDTIYYPHVSIVHEHGAASYISFKMLVVHIYNLFIYFNKWGWLIDNERSFLNRKTLMLLSDED